MSQTTITIEVRISNVLAVPNGGVTIGVTRTDTDAEVVATGTAMVTSETGIYTCTFTDPAYDLTYDFEAVITNDSQDVTYVDTQFGTATPSSSPYNYFGADYDDVVDMYPNAVAADFGGQTAIEKMMKFVEVQMVGKMNVWIRASLKRCNGAMIIPDATDDQTEVTLPSAWGITLANTSDYKVYINYDNIYTNYDPELSNTAYTDGDGMTASDDDGSLKITMDAGLTAEDEVVLFCEIDPSDSTFEIESLKRTLIMGTAAYAGLQIYTPDDSPLPKLYNDQYKDALETLTKSTTFLRGVPELFDRTEISYRDMARRLMSGNIIR